MKLIEKIVIDIDNNPVLLSYEGEETDQIIYEHNIAIDKEIECLHVSNAENCDDNCKTCDNCIVTKNGKTIEFLETKKLKIIEKSKWISFNKIKV